MESFSEEILSREHFIEEFLSRENYRYEEEFLFAIEMIILKRNKNGATLLEIRDDFQKYFGVNCESVWGYKCMEQYFKPILSNVMSDINPVTLEEGCILYYMDIDAAIRKLSSNLSEGMTIILEELCIDLDTYLDKLKSIRDNANSRSQSLSTDHSQLNSNIIRNTQPKSPRNFKPKSQRKTAAPPKDCDLYGHILIGDNFFLEIARIDLGRQYTRTKLKQVGQCISGQSLKRAIKHITRVVNTIHHRAAVINLGSVDLLQGRELVDMMEDIIVLCQLLCENRIFPIVTTIPPLANQMHNPNLENKRKKFNEFLKHKFDCIDIEVGFYSNNSVEFNQYQSDAKRVVGTKWPLVLWSDVARQRVLKKLKKKIPQIHK